MEASTIATGIVMVLLGLAIRPFGWMAALGALVLIVAALKYWWVILLIGVGAAVILGLIAAAQNSRKHPKNAPSLKSASHDKDWWDHPLD